MQKTPTNRAAKGALAGAKNGAGGGSEKLKELEDRFRSLEEEFKRLETTVNNHNGQLKNES